MSNESLPVEAASIHEILRVSQRFSSGMKGIDFLVLDNDDEMKGYRRMPLEVEFCEKVKPVVKLLNTTGEILLTENPQLGRLIIQSLIQVQPAADAYRSRMFRYATD